MAELPQDLADGVVMVARHREWMNEIMGELDQLNRFRRPEEPPVMLPFDLEARALVHALVQVLIARDVIADIELLPHKLAALETIATQTLEHAKEQHQARSGLVGPNGQAL